MLIIIDRVQRMCNEMPWCCISVRDALLKPWASLLDAGAYNCYIITIIHNHTYMHSYYFCHQNANNELKQTQPQTQAQSQR